MKPRLTWDGLGVGLSTSIWVIESRENEGLPWFPVIGSSSNSKKSAERLLSEVSKARAAKKYRVAEYRRVHDESE